MTPRAAALAIAASLLIAAPAVAQTGSGAHLSGGKDVKIAAQNGVVSKHSQRNYRANSPVTYNDRYDHYERLGRYYDHDRHRTDRHGRYLNEFGQTEREERRLRRRAVRACRSAIRQEADYIGFRDVDFESRARAYQIGPAGFEVTFRAVEFEGRRRDFERPVTCVVRRGDRVRQLVGVPTPGRHARRVRAGIHY